MIDECSREQRGVIASRCVEIIDGFEHRAALREDDIRSWVRECVGLHGQAAAWHAARASGIGGSDIGVLVRNFLGRRADHGGSAHDIVASKLLRRLPDEDNGDLRRGHANEERHAQMFYAKYASGRDVQAYEALQSARGPRSWMRYSPDDVVCLASARPNPALGGRSAVRVLVDYKAPRCIEEDEEVHFQYACQLHQGAMVCAHKGVHLDVLLLSQFDWAGWALKDDRIEYEDELARHILAAGDHYWGEYVCEGRVPAYVMTPRLDKQDELVRQHGLMAQHLAQVKAIGMALDDEEKELSALLKTKLGAYRFAGCKLDLGDLKITAPQSVDLALVAEKLPQEALQHAALKGAKAEVTYDVDGLVAKLRELGEPVEPYQRAKLDAAKAYEALLAAGEDPEAYVTETLRIGVSKALRASAKEIVRAAYPRPVEQGPVEGPVDQGPGENGQAAAAPLTTLRAETAQAGSPPMQQADPLDEDGGLPPDVREGQSTERLAPRTAMA